MQTENRTVQLKDIQEFDIAEAIALMADEVKNPAPKGAGLVIGAKLRYACPSL